MITYDNSMPGTYLPFWALNSLASASSFNAILARHLSRVRLLTEDLWQALATLPMSPTNDSALSSKEFLGLILVARVSQAQCHR